VTRIIRLTGIDRVIDVYSSLDAAHAGETRTGPPTVSRPGHPHNRQAAPETRPPDKRNPRARTTSNTHPSCGMHR
jgi:hypothetical protein